MYYDTGPLSWKRVLSRLSAKALLHHLGYIVVRQSSDIRTAHHCRVSLLRPWLPRLGDSFIRVCLGLILPSWSVPSGTDLVIVVINSRRLHLHVDRSNGITSISSVCESPTIAVGVLTRRLWLRWISTSSSNNYTADNRTWKSSFRFSP